MDDAHKPSSTFIVCYIVSVAYFNVVFWPTAQCDSRLHTGGWKNLVINYDSRVIGSETLVDQTASNARQCLRMCWLFRACSAVTFQLEQRRCLLYQREEGHQGYTTVSEAGSLAVDMKEAKMEARKTGLYGCDKRPCSETEMCFPVKSYVTYVCVPLMSVFCREDPPRIPNSEAHSDGVSSIVYTCAYGYFQRGQSYISTCDRDNGIWSEVDVTCSFVDCGTPTHLHGAAPSGLSTTVNSQVTYSCLAGAVSSIVQIKVTCEGDTGQWSPLPGSCSVVMCGPPLEVDNMEVTVTPRSFHNAFPGLNADELERAYGAEAVYTCSRGYIQPEGSSYVSLCQADGTWSSSGNFRCDPVDCGEPPHVANSSHVMLSATTFGQSAIVSCLAGFLPEEGITLICEETGNWKGADETCQMIDCGDPPPVDGAVVHLNTTTPNSVAKYKCIEAAVMKGKGNSTTMCQEDGQWSPVSLSCDPIPCGAAPSVNNSEVTYNYTAGAFTAQYTCLTGYVFDQDHSSRTCSLLTSTWSDQPINCVDIECGAAPIVTHATVMETGRRVSSQASYTCERGYNLTSSAATRTCNQDGNWSQEEVTCEPIACDNPSHEFTILSANLTSADSYGHGDTVTVSCHRTHTLIPASSESLKNASIVMTCDVGNWTMVNRVDPRLFCIACDVPPNVDHSTWEIPAERPARVHYACESGYVQTSNGTYNLTCNEDTGVWRGDSDVRCAPVDCGEPPTAGNATFSKTGTGFNDNVTYSCDFNYRVVSGDLERTCGDDGVWKGSLVLCAEWNCETPPDLANSSINFTSIGVNSKAVYTCDHGFKMSAQLLSRTETDAHKETTVTCDESRSWVTLMGMRAHDLSCDQTLCPQPPDLKHSEIVVGVTGPYTVDSTVRYACLYGYKHIGLDPVLTCEESGKWSYPFFECLIIDCGYPPPVNHAKLNTDNGTNVGAVAVYLCEPGYLFASYEYMRKCGEDGLWSREFIECVLGGTGFCGDPPEAENATIEVDSSQIGDIAIYHCMDGYRHLWTNVYQCSSPFFSWVGSPGVRCVPVECGEPPFVENAQAFYENTTVGSTVSYRCNPDMVSPSGESYECTSDGSWRTEPLVECISYLTTTCGPPPHIENSVRTYSSMTQRSIANYTCTDGFIGEPFEAECGSDVLWKLKGSYGCTPVNCGDPPAVDNTVNTRTSGTAYGDVAVYECLSTHVHTGSSLKTCQANAEWSTNIVECVPENVNICSEPPVRDNTLFSYNSRAEGAVAVYTCNTGYSVHNAESVCNIDGRWTEPQIACDPIICDQPNSLGSSYILNDLRNTSLGVSVVHICLEGFSSSTRFPLISTCMAGGSWSDAKGFCQPVVTDINAFCEGEPPVIEYSETLPLKRYHVGEIVRYDCRAGYFPVPPADVFFHTCLPGGVWSDELLQCVPTLCATTSPPFFLTTEFVGLKKSPTHSEMIAGIYKCSEGYSRIGGTLAGNDNYEMHVNCSTLTGWETLPELTADCEIIDCGSIDLPTHWQGINTRYSTTYGSTAEVSCRPPLYQAIPDRELNNTAVCGSSGNWSISDINLSCAPCNQSAHALNIPNGYFEILTSLEGTYWDEAILHCERGFKRINKDFAYCESIDGQPSWTGVEDSRCAQTDWWNFGQPDDGAYIFPVDNEGISDSLTACATLTFGNASIFKMSFREKKAHQNSSLIARVLYEAKEDLVKFQYQDNNQEPPIATAKRLQLALLNEGEEASLCFHLEAANDKIKFSKNGRELMTMSVYNYHYIYRLRISDGLTLQEVHLTYL
ncbi:sushi, von Willebrand factor type a, egf and pentraxin domain-containing protein 1 [Plakobranchus ocellatus]|uniref:Sushi, von Willebrand factor type a, egf and pentraxin domain-containing protein 1 n=1 Tax=Plakobranchus ocellatus TaxID=259542 RepID=A0AAV4AJG8_9GAST|nr:sushi, von Willebrand factor type a, egf and pentraxin domain-containing protein 1 [Plakobranchus ocellatus]